MRILLILRIHIQTHAFTFRMVDASYGKTGQLLRVSGAAVPFRTVRSTAMLARSATGEVNTVIYLYPAC